jgi:phenylacetate-CoA ligase
MWDRRRPEWIRAEQRKALRRYLVGEVFAYSPFYRSRFQAAGLGHRDVSAADALSRLPLTTLADIDDPAAIVLRPDEASIQRYARIGIVARVAWAKFRGTQSLFNQRVIDPLFKPVHWHVDEGIPMGSTLDDIERLGELGRRWLEQAGLGPYDVVAGLLPAGPNLPYWQLVLGCRNAGVSAIHLGPSASAAQVAAVGPTVIAGHPSDLLRLLAPANGDAAAAGAVARVHTVLVAGDRLDENTRARLAARVPAGAIVVAAWAPPGVRALWSECRDGDGFHLAPDAEMVEIVDPRSGVPLPGREGEIVWSAIGWRGSALLRLRTSACGALDESPCLSCGRTTPRVRLTAVEPSFTAVLSAHPGIAAWQAELRSVDGTEELLVFVTPSGTGHPGRLLRDLDRHLGVTQYVVVRRDELDARLAEHGGRRLVDLRD